ncbi:MAG: diguanylate cyclase [Thermodesulfobacteriaceae bacterium]|nr:diguanylate cyclase [Thermodesulfobacteriaceae bacterium]MCX8042194.1 diguanylate cyclase [Thermodesulfobacteriaceae bacterium]MDW8136668.1 diguanylate cyclase [Thermodesulfobacterium sp.]
MKVKEIDYDKFLTKEILFEKSIVPLVIVDSQRIIRKVNKRFLDLFGYTEEEVIGKQTSIITPSIEKFHEYRNYFERTKSGEIKTRELQYKKKDGTLFWVKLTGVPILIDEEEHILWFFEDVNYEVEVREKIEEQRKELEVIFDKVKTGLVYVVNGKIKKVNTFFIRMINENEENLINKNIEDILPSFSQRIHKYSLTFNKSGPKAFHVEVEVTPLGKDSYILIFEDISEHVAEKKKLKHLSETDELTNLYNRRAFITILREMLSNPDIPFLSLVVMDIDHFKKINDDFGHDVGDEVLIELAKFLKIQLRENEIIGRLGGEEFGIILPVKKEVAYRICERLRTNLENHFFSSKRLKITVSLGLADNEKINNFEDLYKIADQCLYQAKREGRNKTVVYE